AVAAQLLHVREEVRILPAAVEERDVVSPRERGLDDVTSDEDRATEHEQLHASPRPRRTLTALQGVRDRLAEVGGLGLAADVRRLRRAALRVEHGLDRLLDRPSRFGMTEVIEHH